MRHRLHFFDPRLVDLSMVFQDNLGILYVRLVHLGQSVPAQCLSSRSGKPGSPRFLKSLSRTHLCTARLKKFTSTRVSIRSVFQTMLQSVMPTSLHFFITSSIAESPLVQPSPLQYTRANLCTFTYRVQQKSAQNFKATSATSPKGLSNQDSAGFVQFSSSCSGKFS